MALKGRWIKIVVVVMIMIIMMITLTHSHRDSERLCRQWSGANGLNYNGHRHIINTNIHPDRQSNIDTPPHIMPHRSNTSTQ